MEFENNAPAGGAPVTPAPHPKSAIPPSAGPTSDAPIDNTLQAPAAPAPAQPPIQLQPSPAAPSRSFMGALAHALIGSTMSVATHGLKTLAGPQAPDSYTTDETGKMTPNYSRPDNSRDRIARIAMHALEGLAAGSQVPQQKSGMASLAAGIGAGAASQINEQRQQDLLQRQQATAAFEQQQKALVQKYQNAHWNAQTAVEIENAKKLGEEAMQSHYKNTQDLMAGAREGDLDVSEHSIAEAEAIMAADKAAGSSSFVKHVVLGMLPPQPQLENGKPVIDAQGNQIMEKRLAIITEDKNGNVVLSPSMVQRIQRVGKMAQITNFDGLKPGQPIPLENFKNLFSRVKAAENIVATKPPEIVQVDDGTGKKKWMKSNALGEKSDLTAEEALNWQAKQAGVAHTQAQTRKEDADAAKLRSDAANKDDKPIYAFNTQTKQLEQITRAEMNSQPGRYTNPVDVKESDIRKDQDLARQLGDAQMNVSRYRAASNRLDQMGESDRSRMAALIGDDKFKAEFMGAQLPVDWLNKMYSSEQWPKLSPEAQDAVIGYIGARGAVIAYQKAVSGSGRSNKEQLELELQNIPNPLLPKNVREKQFDRFQANIDQTGAGLPKMVGVDRPQEIRQRIEAEESKRTGATHIYDPGSGQTIPVGKTPVKNYKGQVLGYFLSGDSGEWVRFPKQ